MSKVKTSAWNPPPTRSACTHTHTSKTTNMHPRPQTPLQPHSRTRRQPANQPTSRTNTSKVLHTHTHTHKHKYWPRFSFKPCRTSSSCRMSLWLVLAHQVSATLCHNHISEDSKTCPENALYVSWLACIYLHAHGGKKHVLYIIATNRLMKIDKIHQHGLTGACWHWPRSALYTPSPRALWCIL